VKQPTVTRNTSDLIHHVQMGQYVSVEVGNVHRDRFSTRLIGMLDPKYLILELPSIVKRGELIDRLILNNPVTIRMICERTTGECLGFQTRADSIVKHPFPLFFVSFPVEIFTYELRREERLDTLLPARVYNDEIATPVEGTITDISKGGCRFIIENDALVTHFDNTQTLNIAYPDPARGGDAVKVVRLCSKRKYGKKSVALGLEFVEQLSQSA
jgi:c-di-GMP-binding flagellar brake protein YcgR